MRYPLAEVKKMYNFYKQTFVVLEFATIGEFTDNVKKVDVRLQREAIAEVAAVKISKGKIEKHYQAFVAIDGYDAHNIEFGDGNFGSYNLSAEHLIGAPSLKDVSNGFREFIGDSILIVNSVSPNVYNPFIIFKDTAQSLGYCFNNPVISLNNVLTAARLQKAVKESGVNFENASTLQIAQMLSYNKPTWTEIFADYDIYFNPDGDGDYNKGRNDPLSRALAFARLFIALVDFGTATVLEPIDEPSPF